MKEMTNDKLYYFNVIGVKKNQTSVSDADREIPTLGSTDDAGNSFPVLSVYHRVGISKRFYM